MPIKATIKQTEIFGRLVQYFATEGYRYLGYDGPNDDSHMFGTDRKIVCYVKFVSTRATVHPKESIMVIIKQNKRNKEIKEFQDSNDLFGQEAKRVFIIPNDKTSYDKALRLIDTI